MRKHLRIVRPVHEIQMFGGPDMVTISIGTIVRIHPGNDLFMQGATTAEIRVILDDETVKVRPYVMGRAIKCKLRTIPIRDILIDEKGIGL